MALERKDYFICSLPEVYWSDTNKKVKSYDHMLLQSLDKIFRERCLSSSVQIKRFLRSPELKSIIKPILEQEPILGKHFSKEQLGQLSLLWIAVLGCYHQSAELLVRSGADVNELFGRRNPQVIDERWTILHVLLQIRPSPDNEYLIRLVVDHGADLQGWDSSGRTILYYAMVKERVQMTEMLLIKGAGVNLLDRQGMTPLFMVVTGVAPLHMSLTNSTIHNELVPLLIKHGANLQSRDFRGRTVLHIAIERDQVEMTKMLLERGADVNVGDIDGITPLLEAVGKCQTNELVPLLMKYGADLQVRDHKGQTVLHYAVKEFRVQMTEMLLEKGADVNAADNEGMTPLLFVVSSIQANVLAPLLIKHGADVFCKDRKGMNALHHLSTSRQEVVELARFLIAKGVSFYDRTADKQYQPIHLAAQIGSNELVDLFLDQGANVNSLTKEGESPLYIAVKFGQYRLVKTLLKRDANVNLKTFEGCSPLHTACSHMGVQYSKNIGRSMVVSLVTAGADVLDENKDGKTPLALITSAINETELGDESRRLIEALALKKALKPSIKLKDEMIIERYLRLRNYYRKCSEEIKRMKPTRLIKSCNFFELLTKSQCQIAALMRNPEFETKFRLYDLNDKFSIYAEDILRAFEGAQKHYHSRLQQAKMIDEAVYNILPYLVVQKVVYYLFDCCRNVK